jgi:peptidoglycan/xylan/chitin deacetylase (PgdA/CDA1 family)
MTSTASPRDLTGYGRAPPHPRWPGNARIALQFVLNHEEGGENSVLNGDATSETFLSEIIGAQAFPARHLSMESLYEYGSRAGLWRVLRAFEARKLPLTVFAVARALQQLPEAVAAYRELGHEIACHGLRWISYQTVDEATERAHIAEATAILTALCGDPPLGWYTGRDSPNTRRLVVEHGGFVYDADSYADDLPYWREVEVEHDGRRATGTASRRALRARQQRHALCHRAGLQQRPAVFRLPQGCVRRAVSRRRSGRNERAEDAVDRAARAHCRPPGANRRA